MSPDRDCRTCQFNLYSMPCEFVDCTHPVALERGPQWQRDDPAIVNYRTSDIPVERLSEMDDCPTWEPRP